jgi:hypothetical protein
MNLKILKNKNMIQKIKFNNHRNSKQMYNLFNLKNEIAKKNENENLICLL